MLMEILRILHCPVVTRGNVWHSRFLFKIPFVLLSVLFRNSLEKILSMSIAPWSPLPVFLFIVFIYPHSKLIIEIFGEHCSIELSAVMEMFHTWAILASGHTCDTWTLDSAGIDNELLLFWAIKLGILNGLSKVYSKSTLVHLSSGLGAGDRCGKQTSE